MSLGAILVGLGLTVIVVAYVTRPFGRHATHADDVETMIETWVASARRAQARRACLRCGQTVARDDAFCSRCGSRLED